MTTHRNNNHPSNLTTPTLPFTTVDAYGHANAAISHTRSMLYNASKKDKTIEHYSRAYEKFKNWCHNRNIDDTQHASIDNTISTYLSELYLYHDEKGSSGKTEAAQTVFGLLHFQPTLQKTQLRTAIGILAGWNRLKPSISHPPMTFTITVAVAVTMMTNGHIGAAIATLTAWDCYLRVSELCNLKVKHILTPDDTRNPIATSGASNTLWRPGPHTIVTLPQTKSASPQYVFIDDQCIDALLVAYIRNRRLQPDDHLFPYTTSTYTKLFHQVVASLQMRHIPFTPHSLRHGGATGHFIQKGEAALEQIQFRGRWVSTSSLRTYIQASPSININHHIPHNVIHIGNTYKHHLLSTFLPYV
jgi:integrase